MARKRIILSQTCYPKFIPSNNRPIIETNYILFTILIKLYNQKRTHETKKKEFIFTPYAKQISSWVP